MLGSEPIGEVEHAGARGGAEAPGEIPQERRGADRVGPAVKVENAAIAARLANDHANRIDAAAVDDGRLRACRRARHNAFDTLEPTSNRGYGQQSAALAALQLTQRQPQELGLHA